MPKKSALFRTEQAAEGVRLHLRRTKAFKTLTARLVFHADLDEGTAARALVPRVLARGTRRLPSLRALQLELDSDFGAVLDGGVRKLGERHLTSFRAEWISDRLAEEPLLRRMGALLGDVVHDPATDPDGGLREEIVVQERKKLADEADAVFDDKGRWARQRLLEKMCRHEAYARPSIGRAKEIRATKPEDVRAQYEALLDRAPVDLFLVGDLSVAEARRFLRGLRLEPRRQAMPDGVSRRVRPGRVRSFRERQEIGQAKLVMGFRTPIRLGQPLSTPLAVMNALFGGTATSKLFKNVREKASLCYAVGSSVERTKGILFVHAGIDAKNYARARKMILQQLEEIREGKIAEEDTSRVRSMLQSALNSMRDSPDALIDFALERVVNGVEPDLERLLETVASVSKREVMKAAATVELDSVYLLSK